MLKKLATLIVIAFVAIACGGGEGNGDPGGEGSPGGDELVVQAANYEVLAGEDSRFIAGILTTDQSFVSYGEVDMSFFYLGTEEGQGTAEPGPEATGTFLAIEGDASRPGPIAGSAMEGRGVYAADVVFDKAGFWAVEVEAELDGEPASGRAVFEVVDEPVYPAVGDPAPKSKNLVVGGDAPPHAIDSRAQDGSKVPDQELHRTTIADAVANREPVLAVFATPVYCVSRFCGPITDMVSELEKKYRDRARFVHVEVWWNFQKRVVNRAAAQWIYRKKDITEPWIYLVGSNGEIAARWDNVATIEEIEPILRKLPPLD